MIPRFGGWHGRLAALVLTVLSLALSACAQNPVTGRGQLFLISSAQEAEIGAQQNPQVIRAHGGIYDDPDLAGYVDRIGQRLVARTERPDLDFTFTVLDSDIVNAFALPGGYVYVTRGLIALANSEAELAAVLAHEISHVTARHSAERYSQSALAQIGIGLLGAAVGSDQLVQLAGLGAQAYLSSYNREQESEADAVGIRYLAAAGYNPDAMVGFLEQMEREARLRARISGAAAAPVGFFSTHPQTTDRVVDAARVAAGFATDGTWDREGYLAAIDGVVYGPSADDGIVRGRIYASPAAGILWEAPPGFELRRSGNMTVAAGPADSRIAFDIIDLEAPASALDYLTAIWAENLPLASVERIDVSGFPAATGAARLRTRAGLQDFRLVAIAIAPDRLARFTFITRPDATSDLAEPLQRATYSFRPLDPAEATAFRPARIDVVTVRAGETVESLAQRMAEEPFHVERFLTLNGLDGTVPLTPGQRVKLVLRQ